MRSLLIVAALLSNALTSLASPHAHPHAHAHAHDKIAKHKRQRRDEEEQLPHEEKLRKRELHARNTDAANQQLATDWFADGYEGDWYQNECTIHTNYHRENHGASDMQWDPWLAYTAQLVAQSCTYGHDLQYDPSAGQNIAGGLPANNISGCITDLWYNSEAAYFYSQYGQPYPDMTYFEEYAHMTQLVWKGTLYFGCATQYCPYGLANAGSVEPYYTVCNYRDAGNVVGLFDQNVSPPQGAPEIHSLDTYQ